MLSASDRVCLTVFKSSFKILFLFFCIPQLSSNQRIRKVYWKLPTQNYKIVLQLDFLYGPCRLVLLQGFSQYHQIHPSHAALQCDLAEKCHCADIPKSSLICNRF